jgi:Mg-chelatase subunit ChlD
MLRSCIMIAIGLLVWGMFSPVPDVFAQGTSAFQINVPRKTAMDQLPIMQLKVTVSLASEPTAATPVTFSIKDPTLGFPTETMTFNPAYVPVPGEPDPEREFPVPPAGGGVKPVGGDIVSITAPSADLMPGDPARRRYVLNFDLNSDFNTGASCANTMAVANETWTVSVTAGSPLITGVCLQSFDRNIPGHECVGNVRLVPFTGPSAEPVATIGGFPDPTQGCLDVRPAVDVVLVLDKSGSMSSSTLGGGPRPKMDALRAAVKDFVNEWGALRGSELAPPNDQLGIVFFDSDAHWVSDPALSGGAWDTWTLGLNAFNEAKRASVVTNIDQVMPGGATSIGDGLLEASAQLFAGANASNGHRKVILLMSNGMENTDQRVRVNNPTTPTEVQTYLTATPAVTTPLPNQGNLQIYAVTVGTSTAVSADINEDMATATNGFYINTEDNAEQLRPFFLELLQNFLKFNTYETVRMISAKVTQAAPYSATIPVTTTSQSLALNLMWDGRLGRLRLTVTPPGGGAPIVRTSRGGSILVTLGLPLPAPYDPTAPWNVQVELDRGDRDVRGLPQEVPFDLVVLADDLGVNSELSIVGADYAPGDQIRLRAKVTTFGKPVLNLGSDPSDRLLVQLVRPGVGIGDLLSGSQADTKQPTPDDLLPAADAKLHNELQNNPASLVRTPDTITLRDDGNPANGDDVARDGIYSGVYQAQLPGHYNFLFALEGTTEDAGRFSRQQLKTAHVRSVPDATNTALQTSVQQTGDGSRLVINMTPRTSFNNLMGPSWGNYFWFTTPGRPAFKAQDNLDGTYTAGLNFSGAVPAVTLHFLRVSVAIDDRVAANQLPVPLGGGTVLVPTIPGTGKGHEHPWLARCFQTKASLGGFTLVAGLVTLGFIAYLPGTRRE